MNPFASALPALVLCAVAACASVVAGAAASLLQKPPRRALGRAGRVFRPGSGKGPARQGKRACGLPGAFLATARRFGQRGLS